MIVVTLYVYVLVALIGSFSNFKVTLITVMQDSNSGPYISACLRQHIQSAAPTLSPGPLASGSIPRLHKAQSTSKRQYWVLPFECPTHICTVSVYCTISIGSAGGVTWEQGGRISGAGQWLCDIGWLKISAEFNIRPGPFYSSKKEHFEGLEKNWFFGSATCGCDWGQMFNFGHIHSPCDVWRPNWSKSYSNHHRYHCCISTSRWSWAAHKLL